VVPTTTVVPTTVAPTTLAATTTQVASEGPVTTTQLSSALPTTGGDPTSRLVAGMALAALGVSLRLVARRTA
jgi:hypothetical protein